MKVKVINLKNKTIDDYTLSYREISVIGRENERKEIFYLIDNPVINKELNEIIIKNENYEVVFSSDKETDREMVQLYYSLHFYTKEFKLMQDQEKERKEKMNELFSQVQKEYPQSVSQFKTDKTKKKTPYYHKNRPF